MKGRSCRPIVSSVGTIVHNITRFFVPILGHASEKTEHHVKDCRQFSQEARELSLEPGEVMMLYDVKSLFTCTPPKGALEAVRSRLEEDDSLGERTKLSVQNVGSIGVVPDIHIFFLQAGVLHPEAQGGDWFPNLSSGVRYLCG